MPFQGLDSTQHISSPNRRPHTHIAKGSKSKQSDERAQITWYIPKAALFVRCFSQILV